MMTNVMTAASSQNKSGDKTGGLNTVVGYVYQIRIKAKALKKQSFTVLLFKDVPDVGAFLPDFCTSIFILKVE